MGAEINEAVFDDMEVPDLKTRFDELVEKCKYDYGHSGYTGTFAEVCDGLHVPDMVPLLDSKNSAIDYLNGKTKKWEAAQAVRFMLDGHPKWLVMAWCSC